MKIDRHITSAILAVTVGVVGLSNAQTPAIWNLPAFPIATGPYDSTWTSLQKYSCPAWFRSAKFGIWAVWDPTSVPEQGDWYARYMYQQGSNQYNYHLAHYGHPSIFGYKDLCNLWTGDKWEPDSLMKLYANSGAKYFADEVNHHDNFDGWDSKYQPWNSVNVGPKKDVCGLWAQAARKYGLRFGVTFHSTPARTWETFMTARYGSDATGPKAGVPYDGRMTKADGVGKWWEGLDPVDLNGPVHPLDTIWKSSFNDPFTRQFLWRVGDLMKYKPDLLYFDDFIDQYVALGSWYGMPNEARVIAANYYNSNLQWSGGKQEAVLNIKYVPDTLKKALVLDFEESQSTDILNYPWQTDTYIGAWHYQTGMTYQDAGWVIRSLINVVSRNGNLLLCVPQRGDGSLDATAIAICNNFGAWLRTNGEAIYGSRPFETAAENDTRFTRNNGFVYALALTWPSSNTLTLTSLKKGGATIGNVTKVNLLGYSTPLTFTQDQSALTIQCPAGQAASAAYVFKITQDKQLVNDDDSGVVYYGWNHECNRGMGEYNNDVHYTSAINDSCVYTFNGTGVDLISKKSSVMGDVDIYIDGSFIQNVSLYDPAVAPAATDDNSSALTYSGTWSSHQSLSSDFQSTEHFTATAGSYAQYSFTGATINWLARKGPDMGKADVYIDGVLDASGVDCYSKTWVYQTPAYTKTGLSSGAHTIKIVATGTANSSSTNSWIVIDAFSQPGSSTTTPVQTTVFSDTTLTKGTHTIRIINKHASLAIIDAFKIHGSFDPTPVLPHREPISQKVTLLVNGVGTFTLNSAGIASGITFFNMRGKAVRTIAINARRGVWDRMDENGQLVTAGTYVIKLMAGGKKCGSGKIVVK